MKRRKESLTSWIAPCRLQTMRMSDIEARTLSMNCCDSSSAAFFCSRTTSYWRRSLYTSSILRITSTQTVSSTPSNAGGASGSRASGATSGGLGRCLVCKLVGAIGQERRTGRHSNRLRVTQATARCRTRSAAMAQPASADTGHGEFAFEEEDRAAHTLIVETIAARCNIATIAALIATARQAARGLCTWQTTRAAAAPEGTDHPNSTAKKVSTCCPRRKD
jgi:hypothetical protein